MITLIFALGWFLTSLQCVYQGWKNSQQEKEIGLLLNTWDFHEFEAYKAGFIEATKWTGPVSQDADSPAVRAAFYAWQPDVYEEIKEDDDEQEGLCTHCGGVCQRG